MERKRQVVRKHKTKMCTKAHCFVLKMGVNWTNIERKSNEKFVEKVSFLEINKRGGPTKVLGVGIESKN